VPGAEIELVASGGGVFEVDVDGERIHSKKKTGEFPKPGAIVAALQARGGSG
jgi:selenoprotein W-related protein